MTSCAFYIAMVVVQLAYGGSNILMKVALERGLHQLVFVVYRHIIAMLLLGPFAYILERKQRPSMSFSIMAKIFILSSLGTTIHLNVYYAGLEYTSPTVASALSNIIPALTFAIAVLLGMEKVRLGTAKGKAKVLGTFACVVGSLVFTFWKGGCLFKGFEQTPLVEIHANGDTFAESKHSKENWIKGSILILISYVAWSAWLILQALVSKVYPAQLSLTVLICFFASLQSSILAIFLGRNPAIWKLDWDVQLLTIVYCGVIISALVYYLQTWCISHKGPVFAAMFSPVLLIVVGVFSSFAFKEQLHLGSLIGAILIIGGLYCVLWGKMADTRVQEPCLSEKCCKDHGVLEIQAEVPVNQSNADSSRM